MTTKDNAFPLWTTGQANWDSDYDNLVNILERGYHVTEQAGVAINTGQVLWLNSGGFFKPYDPNSLSIMPHALAFTAANSGDTLRALTRGIVRSLGINSPAVPGQPLYVSTSTPGVIVGSFAGADRCIGYGLDGYSVLFDPAGSWEDTIPDGYLLANSLGAPGKARGMSISAYLDYTLGTSWGAFPVRNGSLWQELGTGTTSGWVLTSNGSGALPAYAAAPGGGGGTGALTLIGSTVTVNTATFVFTPGTGYRHLEIVIGGRGSNPATFDDLKIQFNTDTTSTYIYQQAYSDGTTNGANDGGGGVTAIVFGSLPGGTATANFGGTAKALISDYAKAVFTKSIRGETARPLSNAANNLYAMNFAGAWLAAVSSIYVMKIFSASGSVWVDGTVISVYGRT